MKKKIFFFILVSCLAYLLYTCMHNFETTPEQPAELSVMPTEYHCPEQSVQPAQVNITDIPASPTGIILVFDLHGVLLDVDAKKAFSEIGLSNILKYSSARNISFSNIEHTLTQKIYEILNAIQPTGGDSEVLDPSGNRMPALMYDWQRGYKKNSELKALVIAALNNHPEWFISDVEKQLIYQIMVKMFTPEQLVATVKIVPEGLSFIKKCKKQGHILMILSNWDSESFDCLRAKWPTFFELFDAIVISGVTHNIKPKRESFEFLIERRRKFNEKIIFIDDQQENVTAASAAGLHGILCKAKTDFLGFTTSPDINSVKKEVAQVIESL